MKSFNLFIAFALLLSCNPALKTNSIVQEIIVSFDEDKKIYLSEIMTDCDIILLETTKVSTLGEINKIEIYKNKIYISSNNQIFVFSDNGKHILNINSAGRGPGEYLGIKDFNIHSDILYILDRASQNILLYDLIGNHLETRNIGMWAQNFLYLDNNEILIYSGEEDNDFNQCKLSLISKTDEIKGISPIDKRKSKYLHVNASQNLYQSDSIVYVHEAFCDTVFSFSDGQLKPLFFFNYGAHKVPDSFFDKRHDNIFSFFQDFNNTHYVNGIYNFLHINDYYYFKVYKDGENHFIAFNPKTETVNRYSQFINDFLYSDLSFSVEDLNLSTSNGYLLAYINSMEITDNKGHIKDDRILGLLSSLTEESNPILLIYKQ